MNNGWANVALGDVLKRSETIAEIDPTRRYRQVTVRLWGQGVVQRDEVDGSQIVSGRRFFVHARQFILSRIDARNGAFGLVPKELDGAVVTNDFPVFDTDGQRILPEYLGWLSKTRSFVKLCKAASEGTTNRVRLKEDRFLTFDIPLPPLSEQRRIVAKLDQLAAKIEEARELKLRSACHSYMLLNAEAERRFDDLSATHTSQRLGDLNPHVTSGPRSWGARYADSGLRFYRAQDINADGAIGETNKVFIEPPQTNQGSGARLKFGDLMIVITGATIGRVAVYKGDLEPGYVSQHVAICRLPQTTIDPEFALWGLRRPGGQRQLFGAKYGQGKPGLNLTNIRNFTIPVPPLPIQQKVVNQLEQSRESVDRLRSLQAHSESTLDALLPSILDRAFKGDL